MFVSVLSKSCWSSVVPVTVIQPYERVAIVDLTASSMGNEEADLLAEEDAELSHL